MMDRRNFLKTTAAAGVFVGVEVGSGAHAQARPVINFQLGWLLGGNQIGEVCAKQLGYYAQEGIELRFQAGGPNIDGVAVVASGRHEVGQVSSSPSLMLAASQDLPIRCFATGAQVHPYTFFSLKKNPVREPKDMIGKKVGVQATGVILLRALLAKNKITERDVQIVTIGADMSPLLTGQVDVVTGWLTNTTALKVLGPDRVDLRLWDAGVRLYALPYYATVDTIQKKADVLAKFLRASAKGWAYAHANRDAAVDLLVKEFTNLNRADERVALDVMLEYAFSSRTAAEGWGTMDPQVWQEQIDLYAQLGQFSRKTPKLEEVMTLDILKATAEARARIG
ncbi:ABC transporter substrate-binding protein [Phreatobacter stygius]|uniref:Thiamine pyrimidine synthase n=1 Tax=Phreatobacter stygius TaxID=1940610 RepID=A0A4D7AZL0_9HYPH|nr:ABC transporter substrate-binding protein [Phreatobacter stygius]QCI66789.1 twin-arginine translocation signal domain-containing protein [Phreatobacter stygius]